MSILKMINKTSRNPGYAKHILEYITDELKTMQQSLIGGYAGGKSAEAMEVVKKLYHKEGGRQVIHAVLAPSCDGYIDPKEYSKLAEYVSQFFPDYQSCYAVHTDTAHTHIHFVLNTVNFKNGKKFSMSKADLNDFRRKCNVYLIKFGFDPILDSANCIWDEREYAQISGFDFLEIPDSQLPSKPNLPTIDIFSDPVKVEPFYNPDYAYGKCDCSQFFSPPSTCFPASNWRYNDMNNNYPTPKGYSLTSSVPTAETTMQSAFSSVPTFPNAYPTMSLDIGPHLDITANCGDDLSNLIPMVEGVFQEAQRQQQAAVNMGYAVAKKAAGDELSLNIHVNAAPHIHIDFTCDPVESAPIETSMNDIEDE